MSGKVLSDFRTRLLTIPTISTRISTRVFAEIVPEESSLPAISISHRDGIRELAHGGFGLATDTFIVNIFTNDYDINVEVADAIITVFNGYRGILAPTVSDSTIVSRTQVVNLFNSFAQELDGVHQTILEIDIVS